MPRSVKTIPQHSRLPLITHIPKLLTDPCQFFSHIHQTKGDTVFLGTIKGQPVYLIVNPNDVQYILQDNHQNFSQGGYLDGDQIVFGKPPTHIDLGQRKRQNQPAFSRKRTNAHLPLMISKTQATIAYLETRLDQHVDMLTLMRRLSLSINGQILFGTEIDPYLDDLCPILTNVMRHFTYRNVLGYVGLPHWMPLPGKKDFTTAQQFLQKMVTLSENHRGDETNLLAIIKQRNGDQNAIHNKLAPLLFASYETTATTLCWFFYALATHPQIESRVRQELSQVLGADLPHAGHLPQLTYTNQVIAEVLRLYPPVFFLGRVNQKADTIEGYSIPENAFLLVSPYLTQRHPQFWENPMQFNPERFSPSQVEQQHAHAYFPFGSGPHVCIGRRYALTELPLIISMLLQKFEFNLAPNSEVKPRPMPTLLPEGGLPMSVSLAKPTIASLGPTYDMVHIDSK